MACTHDIYVVNSALVKKNEKDGDWGREWLSRNDAGSGSFILNRFDPARGFLARRYDGHFLGPASLSEIDFRYVAEVNSRVLGLVEDWIGRLEESGFTVNPLAHHAPPNLSPV